MQQVQFHPGSSLDGHAVVLSSDNFLRIYNVDEDRTTPEQSIPLSANNRVVVAVSIHSRNKFPESLPQSTVKVALFYSLEYPELLI